MNEFKVSSELIENYNEYYNDNISEWRELGALDKSKNIISLSANCRHDKVLEIGCGEGSILKKLSEQNFAKEYYGLEISETGVEMVNKKKIVGLIECKLFDGYKIPYQDK